MIASVTLNSTLTWFGEFEWYVWTARGYSFGESFVARNVGLRTIWSQGKWCVRLIFQDHDNLVLPDSNQAEFWPLTAPPHTVASRERLNE